MITLTSTGPLFRHLCSLFEAVSTSHYVSSRITPGSRFTNHAVTPQRFPHHT